MDHKQISECIVKGSMDKMKQPFSITVDLNGNGEQRTLFLTHNTETFDFELDGQAISIINNGDNSWSIVAGMIDQETVNLIGTEVEKHYKNLHI
ncbi:hypothetical protein BCY91_06540 [Pelobium manganitolerans]|uniref:Uncharacterized protein n=1 Tax=Pelobium manganitolerans TaxID=1842495 RepID=A0A419S523_9SPHI|nr:hypothetical protein [Pelobium manganitolerans]RKD15173.1 hypothetical protein BCY91_06540 [Pelobium manganitolerans]